MLDFDGLDSLCEQSRDKVLKPVFSYPGGKYRSVENILKHLPPGFPTYVEPFGGTGAVLLNKSPCRLEVFNDRHSGITDFYRCVRDPALFARLCESIELSVHSREMFKWCQETWEDPADIVERAFRWYNMTMYSFSRLGRHWARATDSKTLLTSIRDKLPFFQDMHERLKRVQIENLDFRQCITDYDKEDVLFYLDPPYLDAFKAYKHTMIRRDHLELLNLIKGIKGCVVMSGYDNSMYSDFDWDDSWSWEIHVPLKPKAFMEENNKVGHGVCETKFATETLWVKY